MAGAAPRVRVAQGMSAEWVCQSLGEHCQTLAHEPRIPCLFSEGSFYSHVIGVRRVPLFDAQCFEQLQQHIYKQLSGETFVRNWNLFRACTMPV